MAFENQYKKNILLLQNELDNDYEKFKEIIKNKYKDDINNNEKIKNEIEQIKIKNNLLYKEYNTFIKEKNEKVKHEIKKEFKEKYKKEINIYTIDISQKYKNKINIINNNIVNLEKKFNEQLIEFKKENNLEKNISKNNLENIINNAEFMEKINLKIIQILNEFIMGVNNKNNKIIQEYDFKLHENIILYNTCEKLFKNKMYKIKFYIDLNLLIIKTISENNKNIKNQEDLLLDKLIYEAKELINNYSINYKKEVDKKLYVFLEENLNIIKNNQQEIKENKKLNKKLNFNDNKFINNINNINQKLYLNLYTNIDNKFKKRYYSAKKSKNIIINNNIIPSNIKSYNININKYI